MASACVDLPAPFGPAKMTTLGERFALLVIGQRRRDFQIYYGMISLLLKKFNWSLTPIPLWPQFPYDPNSLMTPIPLISDSGARAISCTLTDIEETTVAEIDDPKDFILVVFFAVKQCGIFVEWDMFPISLSHNEIYFKQ